jgi:uncharacterized protein YciI
LTVFDQFLPETPRFFRPIPCFLVGWDKVVDRSRRTSELRRYLRVLSCCNASTRQTEDPMEKLQFIYVLKLIPRLLDQASWTEAEKKLVQVHFERLQALQKEGKVILAGRTLNMDPTGFGIVILEVGSEEEARQLMEQDPTVQEGMMTAQLFPYRVAVLRSITPWTLTWARGASAKRFPVGCPDAWDSHRSQHSE